MIIFSRIIGEVSMRRGVKTDRAVTPVIAVVILLALTVTVAAISATIMMDVVNGAGGEKFVDLQVYPSAGLNEFEVVVTGGADAGSLISLTGQMAGDV